MAPFLPKIFRAPSVAVPNVPLEVGAPKVATALDAPLGAQDEYDYVIVGSGAGGAPLAVNLAAAGHSVLVLESGAAGHVPVTQVPALHAKASEAPGASAAFFVQHHSDPVLNARDSKYVPEQGGVFYPRGWTEGGSPAVNAMINVLPHPSDFDGIAELTGDPSWRADKMWQYWTKIEDNRYRPLLRLLDRAGQKLGISALQNRGGHGFDGWLTVSRPNPKLVLKDSQVLSLIAKTAKHSTSVNTFKDSLLRAFQNFDPNDLRLVDRHAHGLTLTPLTVQDGQRGGSRVRLEQGLQDHPDRLTLQTNATASRVLFDENHVATGVEYLAGPHLYQADREHAASTAPPETRTVHARREVILSAGTINSAQLLKLSGIGPRAELEHHGIDVVADRAGVGANVQDRLEVGVVSSLKKPFKLLDGAEFKADPSDPEFRAWVKTHGGVYSTNGSVIAVTLKSKPDLVEPDLYVFGVPGNFHGYYPGYSEHAEDSHQQWTWVILKAHTQNHAGTIKLRSADPTEPPDINTHSFEGPGADADVAGVVHAIRFVRDMQLKDQHELIPGPAVQTDAELAEFVRDEAWGHHLFSSNRMGRADDPGAVVGSDFKVHGTDRLRVVDGSVAPKIPGMFPASFIYMISEKASAVILADAAKEALP